MRRTIRLYSFNQRLSKSSSYRYIDYPELAREVMRFAFEDVHVHRLLADCHPANEPSWRLLEKLGFRREAVNVESHFEFGEWTDNYQYAMLAREFFGKRD